MQTENSNAATAPPATDFVARGWRMVGTGVLEPFEHRLAPPGPGRVIVEVAGCGVCHTDLGYLYGGVPTKKGLPIVLGHEIAGVVCATGPSAEAWLGSRVIVPAVWPCGTCRACRSSRATSCRASVMPGNDADGGFASHIEVPSAWLCRVDPPSVSRGPSDPIGPSGLSLAEASVIADAVTTPLQALRRASLSPGESAVVVGVGGVGSYAVQLACAFGAHVTAIDVDEKKLARAESLGAKLTLDARTPVKALREKLREFERACGADGARRRLFEMSGTVPGQELAWSLLAPGASVSVVGYAPQPVSLRLSNLMAFDAEAFGNWGADPSLYPEAVALAASGRIRVKELVRLEPLSDAVRILRECHEGRFAERVVLVP